MRCEQIITSLFITGCLLIPGSTAGLNAQTAGRAQKQQVRIYLSSDKAQWSDNSYNLVPVYRVVKAESALRAALEMLLTGPTEKETAQGLTAPYTQRLKISRIQIKEKLVRLVLVSTCADCLRWGGELAPDIFREAIKLTMKQFTGRKKISICLDGYSDFGDLGDGPKKKCR